MLAQWLNGASQVVLVVKNLPANAGEVRDMGPIPGLGKPSEGGYSNPLQYSCLENSMERETWQATIQTSACMHAHKHTHIYMVVKYKWDLRTCFPIYPRLCHSATG